MPVHLDVLRMHVAIKKQEKSWSVPYYSQSKQPTHKNQDDTYQPMREYPDKTMQLQQDIQNQSNKDMTRMLGNSVNGKRR